MADTTHHACAMPELSEPAARCDTNLLRSEIEFWQEMIQASSGAMPAQAMERMQFALALARKRLAEHLGSPADAKPCRVVEIHRARREKS